ncbi:glycosyltransferase family 4 protein [Chitinophaga varians]|uniref:Glycosyltransferase family 4 protein n=2 Tax=Chitinophagaceae TaxID=563835 RepID=A0A847RTV9_9BACT|nr:glycosyltransferase family 4 protein [Chitinophaga varians]
MYNFRRTLMSYLREKNFEIVVAAPVDAYSEKFKGLNIEYYPISHLRAKGKNPLHEYQLYQELIAIYKKVQPDLIFHYTIKPNIYGTMAASQLKIPNIAVTTGLGYVFSNKNLASGIAKWLYKRSLRRAAEVWFLNREDMRSFVDNGIITENKAFVLPGEGVDTAFFSPVVAEKKKPLSFRFLLTGRMIYEKGVGYFVDATRILKQEGFQFESVLLGFVDVKNPGAISRQQISEWEAEGIAKFLGETENVVPVLQQADCLVLPSYYREGIPRALLEAASMALPIITTNNVGCKDVVDDNITGYLCEMNNTTDLADKMRKMIEMSPSDRKKMGNAGRLKVLSEFDEQKIFEIYLNKINTHLS